MAQDLSSIIGLINGLGGMSEVKIPESMFFCKMKSDGKYIWGFLSPFDDRLKDVETKVEVTIAEHQSLIQGGQIVYFDGKLFNSDKYILDENGDFMLNESYEEEKAKEREERFNKQFIYIPEIAGVFEGGYYRKQPKKYVDAMASLDTANNYIQKAGTLPEGTLIFYQKPDFTKAEECTEEWLVNHQIKVKELNKEEFDKLYITFVPIWNSQE